MSRITASAPLAACRSRRIDRHLLAALEAGLPDCSGVALGVDRVVMLALGAESIGEVLFFTVDRA
ncbi:amino acid--tRNA ligase-related protein [Escherichia coli]